jgi:hypothetical protein
MSAGVFDKEGELSDCNVGDNALAEGDSSASFEENCISHAPPFLTLFFIKFLGWDITCLRYL